jgi:hypothetical protein
VAQVALAGFHKGSTLFHFMASIVAGVGDKLLAKMAATARGARSCILKLIIDEIESRE